ncbi:MAG TPA: phosphopantetheine-binding protein [Rhodocyclaceae bacterium]|nr:phosphopantetheine-binding protein [Rhodocyclaceae bacterium]
MEILEFLKSKIIVLNDVDIDTLTAERELKTIGLDSLDYVSIQMEITKKYGVQIDYDDFSSGKISTLGDFAGYIGSRLTH